MPKLREYMATGIVSIFCISVSVFIFFEINSNNRNDAINNFNTNANGLIVILEKQLSSDLILLRSLTGFIENSPRFDRDSFQKFLQVVSPDRQSFQALEWIPRVPLERRHAYETFAHLDGFPDFQITERSPQGDIQAVADREEYFPVLYVEPYKGNEAALGFDLASNPARLAALEKARDSGEMVVSKKVNLLQLEKENAGVLALTPVYRKGMPRQTIEQRRTNLIGFTLGVIKLSSVVTDHQALDRVSGLIRSSDVDFYLYDNTPQSDGELLHIHSAHESERTAPSLALAAARSGLNLERTISIGGREWLLIARPADSRLFETITLQSWLSLLGMLVISGLVIAYLISIVRQADLVQTLVEQRTEELNAATQIAEDREERISAVVATVVDGIVTIDSLGNIETFNPAAARIFGYAAEEAIGQNEKFLMPEPYYSEHDGYLKKFAETGEKSIIGIGRNVFGRRKDGSTFPMALSVSEMNVGGKAMFTGVVRDITESQRAEKMKTEFVATVSHELRTPLTSIKGSLGLIRSGSLGELSDKLKSMLDIAYSNSDRLIRLINDILDIEKIEAGKTKFEMVPLDLGPLLEQSVEANRGYGEASGVTFAISSNLFEARIKGDRGRLLQVLANLMSNAAKFSSKGDTVEISLSKQNDSFRVSVIDHGPGIPEEFRDKIFGKFSQADSTDIRQKGGTGLGLNISKAIVEEHGGTIGFKTETGRGTTFYFDIAELKEAQAAEIAPLEDIHESSVLICEDDQDIATLLEFMLMQDGFRVDIAKDAAEAEEFLKANSYDAMTVDLALPDKDGVTLIREIRADFRTRDLPIVVISNKAEEGAKELSGESVGIIDWLEKPIDRDRLTESLRQAVPLLSSNKARILHVENDLDVLRIVSTLVSDIAEHVPAETLSKARSLLDRQTYDLVILDLSLPDGNGEDILPVLNRREHKSTPVIIFSASDASKQTSENIKSVLVKTMSSNETLLDTIHSAIKTRKARPNAQSRARAEIGT